MSDQTTRDQTSSEEHELELNHTEWNGQLYCERHCEMFDWETGTVECPHCGDVFENPGMRVPLPPSVAAYHDDYFVPIVQHLKDEGLVENAQRVEHLSLEVSANDAVTVTEVQEVADD